MALEIKTLGRVQVRVDGVDVTPQLDASRLFLLAYLADTSQPQPRERLAELLWPNRPQGRARSNLRTLLSRLRPLLADYLQVAQEWIALQPPSLIHCDVHAFAAQIAVAQHGGTAVAQQALATAMSYYQGDFLATYAGEWNSEIENWMMTRRLALHGQAVQALRQLLAAPGEQAQLPLLDYARQLLQLEPLDESACSQLMQLLAWQGQRDEALWYYQRYQTALSDVWATATPSDALVLLAAKIRLGLSSISHAVKNPTAVGHKAHRQPLAMPAQPQAATVPQVMPPEKRKGGPDAPTPAFHFPAPLKPLIGRRQEGEQLVQWLDLGYRLISITGLGGVGKSHFVQTVIAAQQTRWPDGALYIALPASTDKATGRHHLTLQEQQQAAVALLGRALAAPLAISLLPHQDYGGQLQSALNGYACCLVLDNFEQILPAAAYLQSLLAHAGNVTVIAISRLRLGLAAEVNLALTGLPLALEMAPVLNQGGVESRSSRGTTKVDEPASGTALALLTHNLLRHLPGFQPTDADRVALQQICQAVHGLPLALEMAPVLARRLPLVEVAARLTAEPLTLTGDFADLPEQQRSLYTVLDAMFTAASPAVQEALVRLSVFAGPFTVTDAACLIKSSLFGEIKQQSWLETVAPEQLTLHPLVVSFVRSLCVDQQWAIIASDARRRHAAYYADRLAGQPIFQNSFYTEQGAWLRQHFAEVTKACQTLLAENPSAAINLLHVITMYGHHFGDLPTVQHWLQQGLIALPVDHPARLHLLLDYATCVTELRDLAAAEAALAEAQAGAVNQPDQAALMTLYERLGWAAHFDYAVTTPQRRRDGCHYFSQALALAEAMDNQPQVANLLAQRAFLAAWETTGQAQARADLQRAVELAYTLGQPGLLGAIYKLFAYVEFAGGRLPLAQRYNERAMQLLKAETGAAMTLGWLYAERSQIALAQQDLTTARHYIDLAEATFAPAAYAAGLTQCDTLHGILALLENDLATADRCWRRAYRAVYKMDRQEKLTITIMLGLGVIQLVEGDPMLGAQLVTLAREQYHERSFHWVQPEQQLMTNLLKRAAAEMTILDLPAMAVDAQVAAQAILLLPERNA